MGIKKEIQKIVVAHLGEVVDELIKSKNELDKFEINEETEYLGIGDDFILEFLPNFVKNYLEYHKDITRLSSKIDEKLKKERLLKRLGFQIMKKIQDDIENNKINNILIQMKQFEIIGDGLSCYYIRFIGDFDEI